MRPFIVVRLMNKNDEINCQELVKDYVMSFANDALISCLFREITLQTIILVWAIMFIFLGLPLLLCIWAIPLVIFIAFCCVYITYYNKAMELAFNKSKVCWVAEAYEPHFLRCKPKEMDYDVITEDWLSQCNSIDIRNLRKVLVGTVSAKQHNSLHNAVWLYRMAVNPKYSLDRIGEPLLNQVLQHSYENKLYTVESCTTECQYEIRELMLKIGFNMKQIYHKQVIGNSVKIMMSQMGIDLSDWNATKNK